MWIKRATALLLILIMVGPLGAAVIQPQLPVAAWRIDIVEPGGLFPDIAIDPSGGIHVVHSGSTGVHYAHQTPFGWEITRFGSDHLAKIAIDPQGQPHVAARSYDSVSQTMRLSRWSPDPDGVWTQEIIDNGYVYRVSGFEYDPAGVPHIVFPGAAPMHVWKDESGWHKEQISPLSVYTLDLAIDAWGGLHVAFEDANNPIHSVYYAYRPPNASAWSIEQLADEGSDMSIAVDSLGQPHISYDPVVNGKLRDTLRYAHRTATGWVFEDVDTDAPTGRESSISIDTNDRPHIAYQQIFNRGNPDGDPTRGHIKYAHQGQNGEWIIETPDLNGIMWFPSLALDSDDQPHIAYMFVSLQPPDPTNTIRGELRVASPVIAPVLGAASLVAGQLP